MVQQCGLEVDVGSTFCVVLDSSSFVSKKEDLMTMVSWMTESKKYSWMAASASGPQFPVGCSTIDSFLSWQFKSLQFHYTMCKEDLQANDEYYEKTAPYSCNRELISERLKNQKLGDDIERANQENAAALVQTTTCKDQLEYLKEDNHQLRENLSQYDLVENHNVTVEALEAEHKSERAGLKTKLRACKKRCGCLNDEPVEDPLCPPLPGCSVIINSCQFWKDQVKKYKEAIHLLGQLNECSCMDHGSRPKVQIAVIGIILYGTFLTALLKLR